MTARRRTNRARDALVVGVVPDVHVPFHDENAVRVCTEFMQDLRPDVLIILGDLYDFYDLSSFSKNPDRRFRLQEEFDTGRELVEDLCYKQTRDRRFLSGNHEFRFKRYLREKAPELQSLRTMDFQYLSGLKQLHFDFWDYGDTTRVGNLHFTHGNRVSKHSAYTAKRHFDDYGGSIVHGHTHRLGAYYKTDLGGQHACYEMGHLADPNPEYIKGTANWQQGWGVAWVCEDSGDFWVDQVPFKNGRAMYQGSVWK